MTSTNPSSQLADKLERFIDEVWDKLPKAIHQACSDYKKADQKTRQRIVSKIHMDIIKHADTLLEIRHGQEQDQAMFDLDWDDKNSIKKELEGWLDQVSYQFDLHFPKNKNELARRLESGNFFQTGQDWWASQYLVNKTIVLLRNISRKQERDEQPKHTQYKKSYTDFLSDTAIEINDLINRGRDHFKETCSEFIRRFDYWRNKVYEGQKAAKNDPKLNIGKELVNNGSEGLTDKPDGYQVYSVNDFYRPEYVIEGIEGYYLGPDLPLNPVDTLRPRYVLQVLHGQDVNDLKQREPVDEVEDLLRKYFLLSVIHANKSEGIPVIDKEAEVADLVWFMYEYWGNRQHDLDKKIRAFIKTALQDVKMDIESRKKDNKIISVFSSSSSPTVRTIHDIANIVDQLITNNKEADALFRSHINKLCEMIENYGQALQPYANKLKNAEKQWKEDKTEDKTLAEFCPPPEGWIEIDRDDNLFIKVNASVICRPLKPVNPLLWFGLFGNANLQRLPTEKEKTSCHCFLLAIIHDWELQYSGTPLDKRIIPVDYNGKWFKLNEFRDKVGEYYHYEYQNPNIPFYPATAQERLSQLNRVLEYIRAEITKKMQEVNYREVAPDDIPEHLGGFQILAEGTLKFKKIKENPLPRITLQSPPSDVVTVIKAVAQFYQDITPKQLDNLVLFIAVDNMKSFSMDVLEPARPFIDGICDWLKHNNKDLFVVVLKRYRRLKELIKETDKFFNDANETNRYAVISPTTRTNKELMILFNFIKEFAANLEDTAIAIKEDTGRLTPKKKRKKKKGKSLKITPRQKEAGNYRDQGNNNKEIATLMGISEQRVGVLLKEYDQKANAISKSINLSKTVPYPTHTNELGEEEITI